MWRFVSLGIGGACENSGSAGVLCKGHICLLLAVCVTNALFECAAEEMHSSCGIAQSGLVDNERGDVLQQRRLDLMIRVTGYTGIGSCSLFGRFARSAKGAVQKSLAAQRRLDVMVWSHYDVGLSWYTGVMI